MTNINCSSNCIYQKDGKCSYDLVDTGNISTYCNCAYYKSKEKE